MRAKWQTCIARKGVWHLCRTAIPSNNKVELNHNFLNFLFKMKRVSILWIAALLGIFIHTATAQTATTVNRNLSAEARTQLIQSGETTAKTIFAHLQKNDASAWAQFIPSYETYSKMIAAYPYPNAEKREKAVKRLEKEYPARQAEMAQHLSVFRNKAVQQGVDFSTLKVKSFQLNIRENMSFGGGRGILSLEQSNGTVLNLLLNNFYQFEGKWYVLDNMTWK